MRIAHILILMICFAVCVAAQAPKPDETPQNSIVDEVYLARDDGNGKVGEVVEAFNTNDIPIYCVVTLLNKGPVSVKMNLVAVKVNGIRPGTKVVTTSYTTKAGQNRVNFTGRPDGTWVPGTYRIDLYVENRPEKSLTFEMSGSSAPDAAMKFAPSKGTKKPRKQ